MCRVERELAGEIDDRPADALRYQRVTLLEQGWNDEQEGDEEHTEERRHGLHQAPRDESAHLTRRPALGGQPPPPV